MARVSAMLPAPLVLPVAPPAETLVQLQFCSAAAKVSLTTASVTAEGPAFEATMV